MFAPLLPRLILSFVFSLALPLAQAQVPETGRWQELSYSSTEVNRETAYRYQDQLQSLAEDGLLDNDSRLLQRIYKISPGLLAAAKRLKPSSKYLQWEFHTSDDPQTEAFCMAGGKILLGSRFVAKLGLSDAELAVLLAHEIAHALAEHHREELSEALYLSARPQLPVDVIIERLASDLSLQLHLAQLSYTQEREADQLGMVLAHMAGWPSGAMLSFYRKLARDGDGPRLADSYPSAAMRLSMAKGMARLYGN